MQRNETFYEETVREMLGKDFEKALIYRERKRYAEKNQNPFHLPREYLPVADVRICDERTGEKGRFVGSV